MSINSRRQMQVRTNSPILSALRSQLGRNKNNDPNTRATMKNANAEIFSKKAV